MTRSTVRTAVYVTRTHGGVGGGAPRGAPLSRLWSGIQNFPQIFPLTRSARSVGMTR